MIKLQKCFIVQLNLMLVFLNFPVTRNAEADEQTENHFYPKTFKPPKAIRPFFYSITSFDSDKTKNNELSLLFGFTVDRLVERAGKIDFRQYPNKTILMDKDDESLYLQIIHKNDGSFTLVSSRSLILKISKRINKLLKKNHLTNEDRQLLSLLPKKYLKQLFENNNNFFSGNDLKETKTLEPQNVFPKKLKMGYSSKNDILDSEDFEYATKGAFDKKTRIEKSSGFISNFKLKNLNDLHRSLYISSTSNPSITLTTVSSSENNDVRLSTNNYSKNIYDTKEIKLPLIKSQPATYKPKKILNAEYIPGLADNNILEDALPTNRLKSHNMNKYYFRIKKNTWFPKIQKKEKRTQNNSIYDNSMIESADVVTEKAENLNNELFYFRGTTDGPGFIINPTKPQRKVYEHMTTSSPFLTNFDEKKIENSENINDESKPDAFNLEPENDPENKISKKVFKTTTFKTIKSFELSEKDKTTENNLNLSSTEKYTEIPRLNDTESVEINHNKTKVNFQNIDLEKHEEKTLGLEIGVDSVTEENKNATTGQLKTSKQQDLILSFEKPKNTSEVKEEQRRIERYDSVLSTNSGSQGLLMNSNIQNENEQGTKIFEDLGAVAGKIGTQMAFKKMDKLKDTLSSSVDLFDAVLPDVDPENAKLSGHTNQIGNIKSSKQGEFISSQKKENHTWSSINENPNGLAKPNNFHNNPKVNQTNSINNRRQAGKNPDFQTKPLIEDKYKENKRNHSLGSENTDSFHNSNFQNPKKGSNKTRDFTNTNINSPNKTTSSSAEKMKKTKNNEINNNSTKLNKSENITSLNYNKTTSTLKPKYFSTTITPYISTTTNANKQFTTKANNKTDKNKQNLSKSSNKESNKFDFTVKDIQISASIILLLTLIITFLRFFKFLKN